MKKIVKKIINNFGFNITKLNKETNIINFDELLKKKIPENPTIFDVGGNSGQSIDKFLGMFNNPIIHSFEPIKKEFDFMTTKFERKKNIFLNNIALGEKVEVKEFNITAKTGNSSFNNINKNTKWLKIRSQQLNTKEDNYIIEKEKVKIDTLDNYCKNKKIEKIDLLKIDTQGYEDKVLEGSLNIIKNNNIRAIVTEIMFDDVYDKYFSFSDIEKYLIPNNFRMVGIDLSNNNLFSGIVFGADVYYFNKKYYNI